MKSVGAFSILHNESGNSRFDTVLKVLMMSFVALLAFSSGVYFGREMTESHLKLQALDSQSQSQSQSHADQNDEGLIAQGESQSDESTDEDMLADNSKDDEHGHDANHKEGKIHTIVITKGNESAEKGHASTSETQESLPPHTSSKSNSRSPASVADGEHESISTTDAHTQLQAHEVEQIADKYTQASQKGEAAVEKTPKVKEKEGHTQHPIASEQSSTAQKIANGEEPFEESSKDKKTGIKGDEENSKDSSLPKTVGGPLVVKFTVQVASYNTLEEAKKHASELVQRGFPAYTVKALIKGKIWYRVSVGSFKTELEAKVYRTQLIKESDMKVAIIQKVQRGEGEEPNSGSAAATASLSSMQPVNTTEKTTKPKELKPHHYPDTDNNDDDEN